MVVSNEDLSLELVALKLLESSDRPVGAARLALAWRSSGLNGAEATAGRFLRHLDEQGYTALSGTTRGRTLTEAGKSRLQSLDSRSRRQELEAQLRRALTATELSDLMDLLQMRRFVEVEAARSAAVRATDKEIAELVEAASNHHHTHELTDTTAPSMEFHRLVARASHNRIVSAVAMILLDPANDLLERTLEHISFSSGATREQLDDHVHLAEAIRDRQPDMAALIMMQHMDRLISAVEAFRNGEIAARV